MRRALPLSAVLALAMVALGGQAWARPVPPLTSRVTDEAAALSPSGRTALEQKLASYEQRTGHQFAVLLVRSLEGDGLEDFSLRVVEAWKLGDAKRDDGLLVLVALAERDARIEVGYGLEGAVTDALSSQVIRNVFAPAFKEGRFEDGLGAGLDLLMKAAQGESVRVGPVARRRTHGTHSTSTLFAILFVAVSFLSFLPRVVRSPLVGLVGAGLAWVFGLSLLGALGLFFGGMVLGLFSFRGARWGSGLGGSWHTGRGGFGGGGFGGGGFGGGGGGFGGGGASGKW